MVKTIIFYYYNKKNQFYYDQLKVLKPFIFHE